MSNVFQRAELNKELIREIIMLPIIEAMFE